MTDSFHFINDVELVVQFLKTVHADDDQQKYFKHLSSDDIEGTHKEKGDRVKIAGCRKSCMIFLFHDGPWQVKRHLYSCHFCKIRTFSDCVGELSNPVISHKKVIDDDLDFLNEEYNS